MKPIRGHLAAATVLAAGILLVTGAAGTASAAVRPATTAQFQGQFWYPGPNPYAGVPFAYRYAYQNAAAAGYAQSQCVQLGYTEGGEPAEGWWITATVQCSN
ncbi:hypothetical protein ACFW1A_33120 [Kitasatospora sp. NPDC058965]|uniref:hypothetical protein n=1 Tax=Kitasatospora sp. NPDC058965 TaxID=3346682 RepID=UPI0036CA65E5